MHLILSNFKARQFKNLSNVSLRFSKRFNCFTGSNGAGKTNLLDAIYYLSICKSNFNVKDVDLVQQNLPDDRDIQDARNTSNTQNTQFFRLEAQYLLNEKEVKVSAAYQQNKQKKIQIDGQPLSRMQDHIGQLPVLFITPDDIALVKGYSNDRRKAIDKVLCQSDTAYLKQLSIYQKVIQQRNHHLKTCKRAPDFTLLASYDQQLIPAAQFIFESRDLFLKELSPIFETMYKEISMANEQASYQYISNLFEDSYEQLLKNAQLDDIYAQRTTVGIHKDDVQFLINGQPAKNYGSQGQQKNYLIAFQLACSQYMYQKSKKTPLLLLDDVFDKLDSKRVAALLNLLQQPQFGQVFITDTEISRMQIILNALAVDKKFFKVNDGRVEEF